MGYKSKRGQFAPRVFKGSVTDKKLHKTLVKFVKKSKVTDKALQDVLDSNKFGSIFCWHNYIYYVKGGSKRLYRVCSKCGSRQKNANTKGGFDSWLTQ